MLTMAGRRYICENNLKKKTKTPNETKFKGNVVNQALTSLPGESLKITIIVSLKTESFSNAVLGYLERNSQIKHSIEVTTHPLPESKQVFLYF